MLSMRQNQEEKKQWVLALVGILFVIAFALVLNSNPQTRLKSDIYLRWYATEKLFSEGRNLYDERNGREVIEIVYDGHFERETGYYYPAHMLIFTGPLALLPYPTAHLLWTIAVQLFYLLSIWLMMRLAQWPTTINRKTIFLVLCTLFLPNLQHTIWGQFNTIGVLSLVGCYLMLQQKRYIWAGIWAAGLTFKPHAYVLTLVFLMFWAAARPSRRPFFVGFLAASGVLWLIPAFWEPKWVIYFWDSLKNYVPVSSVLDGLWNPYNVLAILLVLGALWVFVVQRRAESISSAFLGCLLLSLAVWALVVPIVGMFHVLVFPPFTVLLLASYRRDFPHFYRSALLILLLIYGAGLVGFLLGLSQTAWYGQHIVWSQAFYKAIFPLAICCLAWPLYKTKPGIC